MMIDHFPFVRSPMSQIRVQFFSRFFLLHTNSLILFEIHKYKRMEAGLLLVVAGVGYILSKRRNIEPGRVPLNVSPVSRYLVKGGYKHPPQSSPPQSSSSRPHPVTPPIVEGRHAEQRDRPSAMNQYHCNRVPEVNSTILQNATNLTHTKLTHTNMVPFYRGNVPPGAMHPENTSTYLEHFVGGGDTNGGMTSISRGKREQGTLFDPMEFRRGGLGAEDFSQDNVRNQYMGTIAIPQIRNNELPFDQVHVGPMGTASASEDWQRERMMPRNIDELRPLSKQRQCFEGRINAGSAAHTITNRLDQMPQNTQSRPPPLVREQRSADDFMRTMGASGSLPSYDKTRYNARATARELTTTSARVTSGASGAAPVQVHKDATRPAHPEHIFRSQMGELPRGHAVTSVKDVTDYGRSGFRADGNDRERSGRPGIIASAVRALTAPIQEKLRATRKEEMLNPTPGANIVGSHGIPKLTVYDSQDVMRTTRKEVGIHDTSQMPGGVRGGAVHRGPAIDGDNRARATLRESTLTTDGIRNLYRGDVGGMVADPDVWRPAATRKDLMSISEGTGAAGPSYAGSKPGGYGLANADGPLPPTQRETMLDYGTRYGGGGVKDRSGAYVNCAPEDLAQTGRSIFSSQSEYYGGQEGSVSRHIPGSRTDVESMEISDAREVVSNLSNREFMGSGVKMATDVMHMGAQEDQNMLRDIDWGDRGFVAAPVSAVQQNLPMMSADTTSAQTLSMTYVQDRLMGDIEGREKQGETNPFEIKPF